jgi:uncharacterized protein
VPGAKQGYRDLVGRDPARNETVCARVFLWLPLYRPVRYAGRVRCPLLIQVAEDDMITPIAPALRTAKRAPHGISQTYPGGHFDLYFGETFEKAVAEQITFLRRVVGLSQGQA